MSFSCPLVLRSAILGGAALGAGLFGSSSASAQCTDNFNLVATIGPITLPAAQFTPLGTGSSLGALTSTINTINTAFLTQSSAFVSAPGSPRPDQQGGGAWGRVIAGTVDTNQTSTGTLDVSNVHPPGPPPPPATGTQTCHTTTRQDYAGFQVGHDISVLNGGGSGANWHWGVTAGYLEAKTTDITPAGFFINPTVGIPFNTPAGSFSENSQIPFVGIYTAFTKGSFFADGQVRWDFLQNSLTDPNNGLFAQRLDARNFAVTGNLGYNIALPSNWFVEPSAGVVWSTTSIDPLSVAGVFITPGNVVARGTVRVDDIDSVLGRASLSVGKTITGEHVTWQPYFTASVFHEFAGDVTARSTIAGTGNTSIDGAVLTSRSDGGIGTYGQFTLGTAAILGSTGWLGYGRVDYRTGENIDGWTVNAGLRYQFSPQPRGSIKDGPAPAPYTYNWTGLYIGGFVGQTWGGEHAFAPAFGTSADPDFAGHLAGGQIGYNIQRGIWVYGIEGDYGFSNARGGVSCPQAFFFTCGAEADRLASLSGRLGITWGRALFYAKGGWSAGEISASTADNRGLPAIGETKWLTGWTVGGGMEFALTDRWSAKAEYMHYDLGSASFIVGGPTVINVDTSGDTVRVGLNLHFHPVQREVSLK